MSTAPSNHERLESWKEIAAYLGRSVRTVIRWEQTEGLPVRRHQHEKKSSVYAFRPEIDAWRAGKGADLEAPRGLPSSREWRTWLLGLALFVAAAGVVGYWLRKPSGSLPIPLKPEVLTSYPGLQSLPTLSPDANHLAFTWNGSGLHNIDIYVQDIGSAEPRRLTSHPDFDFGPSWSPDGKWLAFLRRTVDWQTSVWLVSAMGGVERKLASLNMTLLLDANQLSWSPDGTWLAVPNRDEGKQGLFLLSVENGEQRRLTASSGPQGHLDPQFSPDGRHLAFRCDNVENYSEICILGLNAGLQPEGEPEVITRLGVRATSPVWSSDGQFVLFSAGYFLSDSAIYRVQVFPRRARSAAPQKVVPEGPDQYALASSLRGGLLAFTRRQEDANLWAVARENGTWKPPQMITACASNRVERSPDLSPDGKTLAFTSNRHGPMQVWLADVDGSHPRQLPSFSTACAWWVRWSPDGKRLAISTGERGGTLYVALAEGGNPRRLASSAVDPCWSPDGEWIYFFRKFTEPTGIFKIRASGGEEIPVTGPPGGRLSLSYDGDFLFYERDDGIWRLPLRNREPELRVIPGSFRGLAAGPEGVFAITTTFRLEFHSFRGGPPVLLAKVADPYTSFTVSRDGNTVIYSSIDSRQTNLMLLRGL